MRRLCVLMCMLVAPLCARAQSVIVRAHFAPAKGILVGQPVRLVVSVLVPNYFTGSADLPEFEIENAIVVLPQDRPENSNEKIGGTTYAGITQTYTIYPQQPGDFRLPPAEIDVSYASKPPESTVAHLHLPEITFHADIPAAAKDLDYFLPTTRLTIQQKWSTPLKNLRAGDSIERTITMTATKMQAMLIPPLSLQAPDGIRIYPEELSVRDQKTDRGDFVYGRRTEAAKYFIEKEGDYTLPPIELKWWNLSTNRLATAVLPAVHFTAVANANYTTELPPEAAPVPVPQPKHVRFVDRYRVLLRLAPWCAVGVVLLWMIWHFVPRVYRWFRERRERQRHSESAYFRNLRRACRRNQASQSYELLLTWLAKAHPAMTVENFLDWTADPVLAGETNNLGAVLFAPNAANGEWNGRTMADRLKKHRFSVLKEKSKNILKLNP